MTGERVFIKDINSFFGNKELVEYLEKSADKELMIVGLQTNFCIDASVKSAFERGYPGGKGKLAPFIGMLIEEYRM